MKRKEFLAELSRLSLGELEERACAIAEELMKLRFRKGSGQLEQTHRLGELKRNLARVRTMMVARKNMGTGVALR